MRFFICPKKKQRESKAERLQKKTAEMLLTYVLIVWFAMMYTMTEGMGDCLTPYCFCNSDIHFVSCNEIRTSKLPRLEDNIRKNTVNLEVRDSMIRLLSISEDKWPMLKHLDVTGALMLSCDEIYKLTEWLDVTTDCQYNIIKKLTSKISTTVNNYTHISTSTQIDIDWVLIQMGSSTSTTIQESTTVHYFHDAEPISKLNIILVALLGVFICITFLLMLALAKRLKRFCSILYRDISNCCSDFICHMRREAEADIPMNIRNSLYSSTLSLSESEDTVFDQDFPQDIVSSGSSTWPRTRKLTTSKSHLHSLRVETIGKNHTE